MIMFLWTNRETERRTHATGINDRCKTSCSSRSTPRRQLTYIDNKFILFQTSKSIPGIGTLMYAHEVNRTVCTAVTVQNDFCIFFTARRVSIARTMKWQDVCPSVCLSDTRRYSVETVIHLLKVFLTFGTLIFIARQHKAYWRAILI